jgi:hypothetical protein
MPPSSSPGLPRRRLTASGKGVINALRGRPRPTDFSQDFRRIFDPLLVATLLSIFGL